MTIDNIRAYRRAEPFRPYVIHTDDGRSFRVFDRFNVALSPGGKFIVVAIEGQDAFETLKVAQIARISLLDERRAG